MIPGMKATSALMLVALAVGGMAAFTSGVYHKGRADERVICQLGRATSDVQGLTAALHEEVSERNRETAWRHAIDKAQEEGRRNAERIKGELVNSERSRERLRAELARIQALRAPDETRSDTAATGEGETRDATIRMLAVMLEEADRLAGAYALEAANARTAGMMCEAAYGALTGK